MIGRAAVVRSFLMAGAGLGTSRVSHSLSEVLKITQILAVPGNLGLKL
jgi:hypothetical protein